MPPETTVKQSLIITIGGTATTTASPSQAIHSEDGLVNDVIEYKAAGEAATPHKKQQQQGQQMQIQQQLLKPKHTKQQQQNQQQRHQQQQQRCIINEMLVMPAAEYFLYTPKGKKMQSMLLKGMDPSKPNDIIEELRKVKGDDVEIVGVKPFTTAATKRDDGIIPFFLVPVTPSSKIENLKEISRAPEVNPSGFGGTKISLAIF